jgi:zinc protease
MADLSAASLDDVKAFFRRFYAPNNATLVICGDIDIGKTKAMVERYFGAIPAGAPIERPIVAPAVLTAEKRLVLEDVKATQPQLVIAWPGVGLHSRDMAPLDALAGVLTADRTSRLTKLLVFDRRLATGVSAFDLNSEDDGQFGVRVSPLPGASMTEIERLVDSVVADVQATPPPERDVQRDTRRAFVGTVLSMESVDAKAGELVSGQVFNGDPLNYKADLEAMRAVTPADVQRVARQYLGRGRVVLSMVPKGKLDLVSQPTSAYINVTPKGEAGQ